MELSQVFVELKQIIGALVGSSHGMLKSDTSLTDLGFNSVGARNLAAHINVHFKSLGYPLKPRVGDGEITESMDLDELSELVSLRLRTR